MYFKKKSVRKWNLILVIALATLFSEEVRSVIFASDCIQVLEKGKPVTDNSVIIQRAYKTIDGKIMQAGSAEVCINGKVYIRQNGEDPEILIFYKTENSNLLTGRSWKKLPDKAKIHRNYEQYLNHYKKCAQYSKTIIIPESKNRRIYNSPTAGKTGGTIGKNRNLSADIKTGKVMHISK